MIIVKWILKIATLPIMALLLIAYWIGVFCSGIVSAILGILSTIFWGFAIVGFLFRALTGRETLEMIIVSFIIFIIPQICHWMVGVIGACRWALSEFVRS